MNRVALAILGVVVAVALLVAIARQSSDKTPAPDPASPAPVSPTMEPVRIEAGADPNDVQLEVKELHVGDGGGDRTSIRIEHPDPATQTKLREFLEAHEQAAIAKSTALDCHAQIAKTSLVSITCVTIVPDLDAGTDAGDAGTPTQPRYESLSLRFAHGQLKQLALADVLTADAGQSEVTEGCRKAAEPDLACDWPPTDFAIGPGGTLFLCHGSHCIDIGPDDAPNLLRPEFR